MAFRNIVLLSDGTGNSSISPTKSNVWRLFESLDLGPNAAGEYTQFAFYDDGVGTSGFKLLRVIGGGFGWGLSRNVRELYRKLCREYEPGDRIYIFGFSRGAFTARVLAHFIVKCGILDRGKPAPGRPNVTMESERGLCRGVRQAYKSYRRGYWDEASWFLRFVSKPLRLLRNLIPRLRVAPPAEFKAKHSYQNPSGERAAIEFIGVFDTVDALGLPIDELAMLIDRWVYPYKFPNQTLSVDVGRACQALAIDDERRSFHPLLWDETDAATLARPERLKQVWFSGMHSNVGGSYSEDNLAHIALDWMIDEIRPPHAGAEGLLFNDRASADFQMKATPFGKLYNSRRGAAVYYRFGPRNITDLSNQAEAKRIGRNKVAVPIPKIHHSVLDRIADLKVGYAPTALPTRFHVVLENGTVIDPDATQTSYSEAAGDRVIRDTMMERAKGHIFWSRVIYICLLFATAALVLMPHFKPAIPGWIPGEEASLLTSVVGAGLRYASGYLPGFASYWTDAWTQSANFFAALLGVFVVMFLWSAWVKSNTRIVAEAGWWHMKGFAAGTRFSTPPGIFERNANRLRRSAFGKGVASLFSNHLLPFCFAVICILFFAGAVYRGFWHHPYVMDGVCALPRATTETLSDGIPVNTADMQVAPLAAGESKDVPFTTTTPCFNTGLELEAGRHYEVTVTADSNWKDDGIPATPKGLVSFWDKVRFAPAIPARRHLSLPWFILTGEIGIDSGDVFPLNRQTFEFVPEKTGTLYLYVNDAINVPVCPIWVWDRICSFDPETWNWDRYYRNNVGGAVVRITKIKL